MYNHTYYTNITYIFISVVCVCEFSVTIPHIFVPKMFFLLWISLKEHQKH